MGFSVKFNWVLQTTPPAGLALDETYAFNKQGNRVFPIDTPIDLIDSQRVAIAKIKILSFLNEPDVTSGTFRVIKLYTGEEQLVLTQYWQENE